MMNNCQFLIALRTDSVQSKETLLLILIRFFVSAQFLVKQSNSVCEQSSLLRVISLLFVLNLMESRLECLSNLVDLLFDEFVI